MFLEVEGIKDEHRRDIWTLLRIVRSNRRSTLNDVTAKFNSRVIFHYLNLNLVGRR